MRGPGAGGPRGDISQGPPLGFLCLSEPTPPPFAAGEENSVLSHKDPRLTEKYFLLSVPGGVEGQTLSSLESEARQMEARIIHTPAFV